MRNAMIQGSCVVRAKTLLGPVIVLAVLLSAGLGTQDAQAKKKGNQSGDLKLEPIDDDGDGVVRPAGFKGGTNSPEEYGTGYLSWGANGGATLGAGNGARAGIYGGDLGGTRFGVTEGYYIMGMSRDFDLLLGGRLSLWWFGLSPGVRVRYRLLEKDAFHLALDAGAYVGFWIQPGGWAMINGRVGAGATFWGFGAVEPGVLGSYFVRDNMEIFFGFLLPITFAGGGQFLTIIDFNLRGGFVYTFKTINLGVYGQIDAGPSLLISQFGSIVRGSGAFSAGIQYRF